MIRSGRRRFVGLTSAGLVAVAVASPLVFRQLLRRWEKNPILHGRRVAEANGCLGCHQPEARQEIPNPGSRWGTVPRLGGGNVFMYGGDRQAIEDFVRHGARRSWLEDPQIVRRLESQRIRMPAFEGVLSESEIADVVAWVAAVEGIDLAGGAAAAAGRKLAHERGCLHCHGVEGSGGVPNPGSIGGFIPGFAGKNFSDLVRNREELEEWVRTGTSRRLGRKPWVRFFWRRQKLSMPAYGDALSDQEIDQLWVWIQAVRASANDRPAPPPR
jgi:mono/diheme cytochrome c family protein